MPDYARLRSVAQECTQVLHQQEKMVGVGRAGLEFQVLIPDARLIVFGVDVVSWRATL